MAGADTPGPDGLKKVFDSVDDFVKSSGGSIPIKRVLICNNGIAAVKCMRSIRRWSYEVFGNDRAIEFVCMVTPEDMQANAEFVRLADYHIDALGGSNNHNYANVDFIIKAAQRMQVQAVWAGWGHCSEYPTLPDGLDAAGIAFLGPPGHAMRSLGDKISSMIVAESAEVPQIPWSGSGLTIDTDTCRNVADGSLVVPREVYLQGCVTTAAEGLASAEKIGFPVMIKASEGGGGKGIRKVTSSEAFTALFRQVQVEVPGSPIFIMKLASGARHLEVQLLADKHGQCIALHGRDCSVQRRHQKIIEEGPAAAAPPEVFHQMEQAAVRLGKLVGYVSTGTVEYLFSADHSYAFLELNPRLQVEHPCSEMITDVNLPAAQLQIAMGVPLHRIADIRHMYGYERYGESEIPFEKAVPGTPKAAEGEIAKPKPIGHVIACRITAENPDEGFKPSSGSVTEINFRTNPDVWGYFSVHATGGLHEFADSQFGHIFSHGKTREHARRSMVIALKELSIRAEFRNTIEYLIKLCETDDFRGNNYTTEWLDGLIATKMTAERPETNAAVICGSLHIADRKISAALDEYSRNLAIGHVLPLDILKQSTKLDIIYEGYKYSLQAFQTGAYTNGSCTYALSMNGAFVEAYLHRLTDGGSLIRIMCSDGTTVSKVVYMKEEVENYVVTVGGKTCIFDKENDPTIMRASSAGKLIRYLVEDGEHVKEGQAFAEVEVMKMVMSVYAKASGRIQHVQLGGAILASGNLIAKMILDDPDQVKTATPFTDAFPGGQDGSNLPPGRVNEQFQTAIDFCRNVLRGFALPQPFFKKRLNEYLDLLVQHSTSREIPLLEAHAVIATLNGRIPEPVEESINEELAKYQSSMTSIICKFPTQRLASIIDTHAATLEGADQDAFFLNTAPLQDLIQRYRFGTKGYFMSLVTSIFQEYRDVEEGFLTASLESATDKLKTNAGGDLDKVVSAVIAHTQLGQKNDMLIGILERIFAPGRMFLEGQSKQQRATAASQEAALMDVLEKIAQLTSAPTAPVALKARFYLIKLQFPTFEKRRKALESTFIDSQNHGVPEPVEDLVKQGSAVFDVLSEFFYHDNAAVQQSALEVYVRRAYVAYELMKIRFNQINASNNVVLWQYRIPQSSSDDPEGRKRRESTSKKGDNVRRVMSIQDLAQMAGREADPTRLGVMVGFETMEDLEKGFSSLLELLRVDDEESNEPINVVNIALSHTTMQADATDDAGLVKELSNFISIRRDELYAWQIRRITFLIVLPQVFPKVFTFRESNSYQEDAIYRHIDPALAFKLELGRLSNYTITHCATKDPKLHVYHAARKQVDKADNSRAVENRFFVRTVMRDVEHDEKGKVSVAATGDTLLMSALDELEMVVSDVSYGKTDSNHIFINAVPVLDVEPSAFVTELREVIMKHSARLWKLRVLEAELRLNFRPVGGKQYSVRLVASNGSGYYMNLDLYRESRIHGPNSLVYESFDSFHPGPFHGQSCIAPYAPQHKAQEKRAVAHSMFTTYVHDYVELMREAVKQTWAAVSRTQPGIHTPRVFIVATELALDEAENLVPVPEGAKPNRVGMLAWQITVFTPTAPAGRDIILISNDVTHVIGSFGPKEDLVFHKASKLARERGIPRVYISVNSGARIGLAQEVMSKFKVAWEEPDKPWKGFKYLYVTPDEYKELREQGSIKGEFVKGESHYKITDIIGVDDGLGVECLRGSGMIAGETSRAYGETFTITLVSCRSVGIGAYLVRLGQRAVQGERSHIILTGAGALNKVLGKDVYTSNLQLGGTQIMYNNGVSHMTVGDDFEGMKAILHWISYVPAKAGATPPAAAPFTLDLKGRCHADDAVDRDVGFYPPKGQYDPRCLIAGDPRVPAATGLFDTGSFTETLGGWAKTVVTGRARLGGIPIGVIAVETRAIELVTPADPANLESVTQVSVQAGQVWYPNSAYKTAQAIKDIDNEKLPLFILANWRGFSGGMRDMYDEVLKFGSMIVDNLNTFKQPIFIYLPPFAELRGGAWVVVDPTINANMIEMYADEVARGGVLEAEGTVEIKFRKKAVVVAMARLDPVYGPLAEKLKVASPEEAVAIKKEMDARYKLLAPMYHQIAVSFADMHDTPVRMKAKGCISAVIKWKDSRRFFAPRLRSRMYVEHVLSEIAKANPSTSYEQRKFMVRRWFFEGRDQKQLHLWEDSNEVVAWIGPQLTPEGTLKEDSQLAANIVSVHEEYVAEKVKEMAGGNPQTAFQCISSLVDCLTEAQRKELVASLAK